MQPGRYSYMAEAAAQLRAAHQVLDDEPKVLEDPLAVSLLGPDTERSLLEDRERHDAWFMKRARTLAIVRSRYTEEKLAGAIDRGVGQYVVLGAGLDTSSYRPGHPSAKVMTFEVDHPDTQEWKLDRLREAGIESRDNLRHVAVDFERRTLLDGLLENGFDLARPAFFSWLGVIYYLHPDAVEATYRQIASCATGSGLALDFVVSDGELGERDRESVATIMDFAESRGEPWLTRYSPGELEALLRRTGFAEVEYLSRAAATQAYLAGRQDGLMLHTAIQLMSAVV